MKKTILCALAVLAVSSCGEVPTEAVPADAVPVEGETLAGTEAEMQAAAASGNGVCEVEYTDDLTVGSGKAFGQLTVTVPWHVHGTHPYRVSFNAISWGPGWTRQELGIFPPTPPGCHDPLARFYGGRSYFCYTNAGVPSYGWWRYDSETGKSSSTFLYVAIRQGTEDYPNVTEISFRGAGGRGKGCNFRGRVKT